MKQRYLLLQFALGLIAVSLASVTKAQSGPGHSTQKATASGARLFAIANYGSTGNALFLSDSARYFYQPHTDRPDSIVHYEATAGIARVETKHIYTYNAAGIVTRHEEVMWEPSVGIYRGYRKYDYTVNAAGLVTKEVFQAWSTTNYIYENQTRINYTADSLNNIVDEVDQAWDMTTGTWVNVSHFVYAYNAQHMRTFTTRQIWDAATKEWVDEYADGNFYDPSGLALMSSYRYVWNAPNHSWDIARGQFNTLDSAARVIRSAYDIYKNGWRHFSKDSFMYTASNDIATRIEQRWDSITNTYYNYIKEDRAYVAPGQPAVINGLSWVSGAWAIGPESYRHNYYYEAFTTGVASQPSAGAQLVLSPNPARDLLYISINAELPQDITIAISDMQGRTVMQMHEGATSQVSKRLSVSELPAGTYILSVRGTKGVAISRMLSVAH
jgi:hypothetical protein